MLLAVGCVDNPVQIDTLEQYGQHGPIRTDNRTENPIIGLFQIDVVIDADHKVNKSCQVDAVNGDLLRPIENARNTVQNHARRRLTQRVDRVKNKLQKQIVNVGIRFGLVAVYLVENVNNCFHENAMWYAVQAGVEAGLGIEQILGDGETALWVVSAQLDKNLFDYLVVNDHGW